MSADLSADKLVGKRLLITNSIIATIGQFLPAIAAVFCVPILLKSLGGEGFAIMNLVWVVLGYFAFFDFGLNRAFVQSVSAYVSTDRRAELSSLFRFTRKQVLSYSTMIAPVVLAGVFFYGRFSNGLESLSVFQLGAVSTLVAAMLPVILMVNFYSGGMIALQEQVRLNGLKIFFGILFFVGPTVASYFSHSLLLAVATLAFTRVVALFAYRSAFWKIGRGLFDGPDFAGFQGKAILSKGLWMFVASIFAPLLTYADRFILGWYSMTEVARYAIPFDLVSRLGSLQASVIIVLFPAMSALASSDLAKARRMLVMVAAGSFLVFGVGFIGVLIGGNWFLDVWLGAKQSVGMAEILPVLMLGLIANMVANVIFNNLQATGKESEVAILQGAELLLMTPVWFYLANSHGAIGLAWGWSVRVFVDLIALAVLSRKVDRVGSAVYFESAFVVAVLAAIHVGTRHLPMLECALASLVVGVAGIAAWRRYLRSSSGGIAT